VDLPQFAAPADAMTAIAIILAMSFGIVTPKLIIDRFGGGSHGDGSGNSGFPKTAQAGVPWATAVECGVA
jgi:hypothetical protein